MAEIPANAGGGPTLTRREAVAGLGAATALASPALARASEAGKPEGRVAGLVFEDRAGTGRRQAGDPGLPGVLVSNGREVARTDAEGRYSLPMPGDGLVFVIKPPGFATARDADNLPRFTYLHQPAGTPPELGLRFRGVAPTGPLPDSVDFGLRRVAEPDAFDVVLFTDPQPESETELTYVRDTAIASVLGTSAAFGLTTGDIMFDDLALLPRYNRMIGRVGIPWWHVGGNHDLNLDAPDAARSRETFKRVYGAPYYAFHHGQALFLMLDNVHYHGADPGSAEGGTYEGGTYEGRFGERQLAFVANVLAETPRDRLVVAAMHIPLRTDVGGQTRATTDADALIDLLAGRPVLSLAGHTHTTEHHYLGPSHHHHVLTAVSGAWWSGPQDRRGIATADSCDGSPNGYHLLSIAGAAYTTRFVPLGEAPGRALRACLESRFNGRKPETARALTMQDLLGSPISAEGAGATDLVVNVFDGGPRTQVSCRIGERAAFPLARVRRADPFVEQVYARYPEARKSWVSAIPSTHVWSARLPADLPPGSHRADILVRDEYGRTHRDALLIEVVGGAAHPT